MELLANALLNDLQRLFLLLVRNVDPILLPAVEEAAAAEKEFFFFQRVVVVVLIIL